VGVTKRGNAILTERRLHGQCARATQRARPGEQPLPGGRQLQPVRASVVRVRGALDMAPCSPVGARGRAPSRAASRAPAQRRSAPRGRRRAPHRVDSPTRRCGCHG
jgi:hypothetical protein